MSDRFKPGDHDEVEKLVAWAVSEETPLELVGNGSKRALGRPAQSAHTLDLSSLGGIRMYEPEELFLTAGPATLLKEIEALLTEKHQALAFEPPDYGAVFGSSAAGTLGGVVATNLSGPRRIKAGAVRDHVLGLSAVSGRGETFKTGGRVVKNVTGYDLCKLMTGSFGTLAALTELTVKVLPAPESARTVLILGLDDATATEAMSAALGSSHDVSGAAHLPAAATARSAVSYVSGAGKSVTLLRLEGVHPSVVARCAALRDTLAQFGQVEELHTSNSQSVWREVRDGTLLPESSNLWRISVAPTEGVRLAQDLQSKLGAEIHFDWGGGLVWASIPADAAARDAGASIVRAAVRSGHATLFRAPENVRAAVDVFQPQSTPVAVLSGRVKKAFDPHGILNPGRMYAGV